MLIDRHEIIRQLEQLNEDQLNGRTGLTHKQYLKKFSEIKNLNSVANQVKRWGAKVTKQKGYSGYYVYEGKNFTVGLNEASCETSWWQVELYGETDPDPRVFEEFEDYNRFDRKQDVVSALLTFDMQLSGVLDEYHNVI